MVTLTRLKRKRNVLKEHEGLMFQRNGAVRRHLQLWPRHRGHAIVAPEC
jgi:hypothetical protein